MSKKRDYDAGDRSKLVLPFLLVFAVKNRAVEEFCDASLALHKGSKETLIYLQQESKTLHFR
jgi:predicted HAD superfamily phosphohydrolase